MNFLKSNQERLFDHHRRTLVNLCKSGSMPHSTTIALMESNINWLCDFYKQNKWCRSDLTESFIEASEIITSNKDICFTQVATIAHRLEKEIQNLLSQP